MVVLGGGARSYDRGTPVDVVILVTVLTKSVMLPVTFFLLLSSLELSDTNVYEP